jgi:hypothetical protein
MKKIVKYRDIRSCYINFDRKIEIFYSLLVLCIRLIHKINNFIHVRI